MKRKVIVGILMMILGTVPLIIGCVPPASDTPTAVPFAKQADLDTVKNDITAVKAAIASKADSSRVDSLATQIGQGGGANAYSKTEIDAKLATMQQQLNQTQADLDAAESKLLNLTGSGGGTSNPTGSVSVITSPTNVQILGNNQVCYTIKVMNGINNWVYVRPIITINAASGQSPTTVSDVTMSIGGTAVNLAKSNFQFTPTLPTANPASSITCIPISGGNGNGEFQIAANTTVDLLVCIQINSANAIIWNIGTSVNSRTL